MNAIVKQIALAKREAAAGVNYTARLGAPCPHCGARSRIYRTMPWENTTRIRYHRCTNEKCPLSALGVGIKSVEADR